MPSVGIGGEQAYRPAFGALLAQIDLGLAELPVFLHRRHVGRDFQHHLGPGGDGAGLCNRIFAQSWHGVSSTCDAKVYYRYRGLGEGRDEELNSHRPRAGLVGLVGVAVASRRRKRRIIPGTKCPGSGDGRPSARQLISAAEQEGELLLFSQPNRAARDFLAREWALAFPKIKLSISAFAGDQLQVRMRTERNAGKYLWDSDLHRLDHRLRPGQGRLHRSVSAGAARPRHRQARDSGRLGRGLRRSRQEERVLDQRGAQEPGLRCAQAVARQGAKRRDSRSCSIRR